MRTIALFLAAFCSSVWGQQTVNGALVRNGEAIVVTTSSGSQTLADLSTRKADAENANLTGAPQAATPPCENISTRLATTQYVADCFLASGQAVGIGDANSTVPSYASVAVLSVPLTAPRTITLPSAVNIGANRTFCVIDVNGGISSANTLTLQAAGSDTIDDAGAIHPTTLVMGGRRPVCLRSDGTSKLTSGDQLAPLTVLCNPSQTTSQTGINCTSTQVLQILQLTSAAKTDLNNTWSSNRVQTFHSGSSMVLQDPVDPTKKVTLSLSNLSAGSTRGIIIPDANSATVVPSSAASNQFATGISALGAVSYAQPAFNNLSGSISAAQRCPSASVPTVSAGAAAGTSPTVSVIANSRNCQGQVSLTVGTSPSTLGPLFTLTFAAPSWGVAPFCTISPAGATMSTAVFIGSASASAVTVSVASPALNAGSTYLINYSCGAAS